MKRLVVFTIKTDEECIGERKEMFLEMLVSCLNSHEIEAIGELSYEEIEDEEEQCKA